MDSFTFSAFSVALRRRLAAEDGGVARPDGVVSGHDTVLLLGLTKKSSLSRTQSQTLDDEDTCMQRRDPAGPTYRAVSRSEVLTRYCTNAKGGHVHVPMTSR